MSNAAKPSGIANARGGPVKTAPMTTAARELLSRQQRGLAPVGGRPWKMPEVDKGDTVLYQPGPYSPHRPTFAAVVLDVGTETLELGVYEADKGFRLLGDGVRHKDDPRLSQLRQANKSEDEHHEIGCWMLSPNQFSAAERKRIKLLLEIYQDELNEFESSGTVGGKDLKPTVPTGGAAA